MPDITDVYKKIRTIALSDTGANGLVPMLGKADAFYYGEDLALHPDAPYIVLMQSDDNPNQTDSFWGDFRPRIEMHVCGTDPGRLHRIVERLDTLFIIPFKRSAYIDTATHVVRSMMRHNSLLLPMAQREEDDRAFQQIVTEWTMKLTAKT